MKKLFVVLLLGWTTLFAGSAAQATLLEFVPSTHDVVIGNYAVVAIRISDLVDFSAPSLGVFDLNINFDPAILSFSSVFYGDRILGDQLDLFGLGSITETTPRLGFVNLFELSLDLPDDLNDLQSGAFTLATLIFDTLSIGTSPLSFTVNSLGDAYGDYLEATTRTGSVDVVPEPTTLLLLGSGIAGLAGIRRMRLFKQG
jgi:hypothetical protein